MQEVYSIALGYGCTISNYLSEVESKDRYFFSNSQTKEEILKEIQTEISEQLAEIDPEIKKILSWLESGKIEITIEMKNPSDSYYAYYENFNCCYYLGYIDRRN